MAIQSSFYATDGTTRTFPSTKHIASKQNVAVYLQSVLTSTWSVISPTLYDLVGNNIVFGTAPDEMIYSEIEIRVADTQAELGNNPSDIAIVASISEEIVTIVNDKANVDNVAGNIGSINTVSGSITSVNSVSANITSVNSVASEVIPNITAILDTPNQALSATNAASAASTSETNAANSALSASTSETNAANSALSASTSETNAANSALSASTSETNAANSASAASISETNAAISEANAEVYAESINPATLTPLTTYNNHIPLSGLTAYHLLSGSLALANSVITNGFSTTLYTGNGSTQSINTGIDMITQWGNDASETFGGLVWLKSRSAATNNYFVDTVRGVRKDIYSNATTAETTEATGLTAFSYTGFSLGALAGMNTNTATYASWNFQTTHRRTGITNHNKAYTEHYNPFTGFTIIKYEGSGLAGHEIPHHLGRKLGLTIVKNLSAVTNWASWSALTGEYTAYLNLPQAWNTDVAHNANGGYDDKAIINSNHANTNASAQQYIIYGWANSYYDEANTLIGNYEVGVYQGTGAAGNKVTTRGKPAWVMIKRLDGTSNWLIFDNKRPDGNRLFANLSNLEDTVVDDLNIVSDGFTLPYSPVDPDNNASGGQYLYMVVYDNDSGSGKSKYPRATDSSTLNLNAVVPFANGVDANGTKVSTLTKNETVSGLTLTEGKNYVYAKNDGTYGVSSYAPYYGTDKPTTNCDFYNILDNHWYTYEGAGIQESRNYLDAIVYADQNGQPTYVEQLPKTIYADEFKANEFKGQNACTAWVNFDGTTTPPRIRDSYNVEAVIRTATGYYDVYFNNPMDNVNYCPVGSAAEGRLVGFVAGSLAVNKVSAICSNVDGVSVNANGISVQIFGGKN